MTGRVENKVALITGAARGQGRSHAVRLAEEGADIIALDLCGQIGSVPYDMATADDLRETAGQVAALGRRVVARQADVRDYAQLEEVVAASVAELGRLDIVSANAGIFSVGTAVELTEEAWRDMLDVNLTGVWHTAKAAIPHLGGGGSIILTSSTACMVGLANTAHYTAAKHGVLGLMRTMANELGPQMIRVNVVAPGSVGTEMIFNEATYRLVRPDLDQPAKEDAGQAFQTLNTLPVSWVEPRDISNAVLFLASDEARYVTGVALPVDAGLIVK